MSKLQVRSGIQGPEQIGIRLIVDPRREFEAEKQRMISNFVSMAARSDKSDRTPSSRGSTPTNQNHHSDQLDIEKMKRDNELSKQRLESLRREVKEKVLIGRFIPYHGPYVTYTPYYVSLRTRLWNLVNL